MDCFRILGIDITKDKRKIKKAYANMIKLHHPEDNMDEYMIIKEAYEHAMEYAKNTGNQNNDFNRINTSQNNINKEFNNKDSSFDYDFLKKVKSDNYKKDDKFFDFSLFNGISEELLESYKNVINKIVQVYCDLNQRFNYLKWKEILDTDEFRKIIINSNIRDNFERFLEEHKNLPQSVWKVINDICGIVDVQDNYFKTIDENNTYIENYISIMLGIEDELSINELNKIDESKIEQYLSIRFYLQYLISIRADYTHIRKEFMNLNRIFDEDPEVYYIMAKERMSHVKKVNFSDLFKKDKKNIISDNLYYIEKAYEMIEKSLKISKEFKYQKLYSILINQYNYYKHYNKMKTITKRISILAVCIMMLSLGFESVLFYGNDSLLCFQTFVIPSQDYDASIYGGTLDKDKAIDELHSSNINSKEEFLSTINYLKEHQLSKSFFDDYNAYKNQKTEELQNLRRSIIDSGQDPDNLKSTRTQVESMTLSMNELNKGNDNSKFEQEQNTGTTKITLYDVTMDDRKNEEKSQVYEIFYHYMNSSDNTELEDDFLCYFEDMIGNYYAQVGYRAGYLSFNEAVELNKEFVNPVLDAYNNENKNQIVFMKGIENISYTVKAANEYLQKFKDNKLGETKIDISFNETKYRDNINKLTKEDTSQLKSQDEHYINELLVKKFVFGYRIDYVIKAITIAAVCFVYIAIMLHEILKFRKFKIES